MITLDLKLQKLIILLILIFLVACKLPVEPQKDMLIRIKPAEKVFYELEYNHTLVRSGELETTWNDIILPESYGNYEIAYWNENFYTNLFKFEVYSDETTIQLDLEKRKGYLEIIATKSDDNLNIKLTSNATAYIHSYCIYHTVGYVKVKPTIDRSYCKKTWLNKTYFANLTNNEYACDLIIAKCDKVMGKDCYNQRIDLLMDADACYQANIELMDESKEINFEINKLDYYDETDYINITFIGMELERKINGQRVYSKDEVIGNIKI